MVQSEGQGKGGFLRLDSALERRPGRRRLFVAVDSGPAVGEPLAQVRATDTGQPQAGLPPAEPVVVTRATVAGGHPSSSEIFRGPHRSSITTRPLWSGDRDPKQF